MFKKTIQSGKMPVEITWTIKISKSDGLMKMVKIAHTETVSDDDIADLDELIKKYADTGVIEEMQKRPDTFLWVRARAIDADVSNENGDAFSEDELLKEADAGDRGKVPAYKTFEGVPIYTNHKNDDIEQAKGKVVHSEWDDKKKCVYCTFFVDTEAYPQLARGIKEGYIKDVSMGAAVDHSKCSICDNKAEHAKDFCQHIKDMKGRTYSGVIDKGPRRGQRVKDELVYEKNFGVKFIELSCVSDGAFENCEVESILPSDKMIKAKANVIIKEAEEIEKTIKKAMNTQSVIDCDELRNLLVGSINLAETVKTMVKQSQAFPENPRSLTQSPADLVNPLVSEIETPQDVQNLAPPPQDAPPNPTTSPSIGVNTLDALKQVIQNINTVIVTLLGTKGINLEHVRDLSKSVADIQDTIEDMIDSGSIDVGGNVPITSDQVAAAGAPNQAPAGPPPPTGQAPSYSVPNEGVGLQVGAKNAREIKLSVLKGKLEKFNNTASKLNSHKGSHKEEGRIMSNFKKLAEALREQQGSAKRERYEQEKDEFKVSIASNGEISAFYRGAEVNWNPEINEEQYAKIEDGQISDFASDLLDQFTTVFSDARKIRRVASVSADTPEEGTERRFQDREAAWPVGRLGTPGYPQEQYIENVRKGMGGNRENDLEKVRSGVDDRVKEQQLEDRSVAEGKLGRGEVDPRVREQQLEEVRRDVDNTVEEQRLEPKRASADAAKIVQAVTSALSNAVVEAMVSPEEVVEEGIKLSAAGHLFVDLVDEYSSGDNRKSRETARKRAKFYGKTKTASTDRGVASYVVAAIADAVGEVTSEDFANGLAELKNQDTEKYASLIGQLAKEKLAQSGSPSDFVGSFEPDKTKQSEIRKHFLIAMAEKDGTEPKFSKASVRSVITAMANTIIDTRSSDEDVFSALEAKPKMELFAEIELAKDDADSRQKVKARRRYWNEKVASGVDVYAELIGNICDRTELDKVSSREVVDTVELLIGKKSSTREALSVAVRKLTKQSGSVTDRSEREFSVSFSLSECGCDKNDPDVESRIKEYVVGMFEGKGYEISDPSSLSFTTLDISEDGSVSGTIRSTVTRSFRSEGSSMEEGPTMLMSDKMIEARRNEREALVKAAQAMGGGGGMGGGGLAGSPGADPAAAAAGGGPGIAAIGGGGEPGSSDENGDAMSPEEAIPTPGEVGPPGSHCPACGSTNTNIAESHGQCQEANCGCEYDIDFQIHITNPEIFDKGADLKGEEDMDLNAPEMGAPEMGAPEANGGMQGGQMGGAPGGAPPMGGGASPTMPMARSNLRRIVEASVQEPLIVRVSWVSEPDVFLRTAAVHAGKVRNEGPLAPGHVCPSCGEKEQIVRVASNGKTNVHCDACGNIAFVGVGPAKDNKLMNRLTWIV